MKEIYSPDGAGGRGGDRRPTLLPELGYPEMVTMSYSSSANDDLHEKRWAVNEEEEKVLQQIKRTRHME